MTPKEIRAHPRFHVKADNYASYREGSGGIRDLSLGGVFVEDPEPLSEGMKIVFELHLGEETLSLGGVVRRSIPNEGMAIQFLQIPLAAEQRLEEYLRTLR